MRYLLTVIVCAVFVTTATADDSGKIKICRMKNVIDSYTRKSIVIPQNATFADVGTIKGPNNGDNDWPVEIAVLETVKIPASTSCVIVAATIVDNPDHHKLARVHGRLFSPSGGGDNNWPLAGANLTATVIQDFK